MKPMKYNYKERKLKKKGLWESIQYYIEHMLFLLLFLLILVSLFSTSQKGGSTTTCHTMKGLAHLNIDVARGDLSLTDPRGLSRHNAKHRNSVHDRHKNSREKQIKRQLF